MVSTVFWRVIPGTYAGLVYRAQIERIAPRKARTLFIEGPIRCLPSRGKASGVSSRSVFDHRGHLIARRFGGPSRQANLVAMHGLINMSGGPWYRMEDEIAAGLQRSESAPTRGPKTGTMQVRVQYDSDDSLRPTAFQVDVQWPAGQRQQYRFLNFNPYLLNPNDPRVRAEIERHAAAVDEGS